MPHLQENKYKYEDLTAHGGEEAVGRQGRRNANLRLTWDA
jgi:hypothetical protein